MGVFCWSHIKVTGLSFHRGTADLKLLNGQVNISEVGPPGEPAIACHPADKDQTLDAGHRRFFKNDILKKNTYFIHNFKGIGNTSIDCAVFLCVYCLQAATDLSVT